MTFVGRFQAVSGRAATFLGRFRRANRGNVAMIFAIVMPVLVMLTLGGVDLHRASTVRVNLQDALDAATLAAARSPYVTDKDLTKVGLDALRANMKAYPQIQLVESATTFTLTEDAVVIANATVNVETLVANIVLPPYGQVLDDKLPVRAHSEVNRSSKNIEVALVLDITGSMAGQRIIDLKKAANELVDIVVQDTQTPYYTRMAVVPYSMGVNVDAYATAARGSLVGPTAITGAAWRTGSDKAITDITRNSPGVITSKDHGFATDDYIWIEGVEGMTQVNGHAYRVVRINSDKYSLHYWTGSQWVAVNTTSGNGFSSYSKKGTARKCLVAQCHVVVTSNNHGLSNGEGIAITGVEGMTQINNRLYEIERLSNDTFSIGVDGDGWGNYSRNGAVNCGRDGCQVRIFRNPSNNLRILQASTCVSERTGSSAYTDASPSGAKVGRNYPASSGNSCPSVAIRPLSDDKDAIHDMIDDLSVVGSTAGQIGMAWGWYAVSPNFNSLWSGSAASAYDPDETVKSVIIMTDGEFNTPYCTGVIAQNAAAGSGGNTDKVNCNGTNGNPFAQGKSLCDGMKARGIVVYTVGLQLASGGDAASLMRECATSDQHFFLPDTGGDLSEAFAAIGRDITRLRISK